MLLGVDTLGTVPLGIPGAGSTKFALAANPGSFAVTGKSSQGHYGRAQTGAIGVFALTGKTALGSHGYALKANTGAFIVTGSTANPDAPNRTQDGETGEFDLTGSTVLSPVGRQGPAPTGSFAMAGSTSTGGTQRNLAGATGTFSLTGNTSSQIGTSNNYGPFALELFAASNGTGSIIGTYTTDESDIVDLGYVGTLSLNISWEAIGELVGSNFLGLTDVLGQTDLFGSASESQISSYPIVNIGLPDGDGGIIWSGWQKFQSGQYQGQYAWFGMTVVSPTPTIQGGLAQMQMQCSVPARIDHYQDQTIGPSGLAIVYQPDGATSPAAFNRGPNGATLPFIQVTFNNTAGDTLLFVSPTLEGVTIKILNGGSGVTRTGVNIYVEGY